MSRVLLVVWGFESYGGMERHVCELALALRQAGVDVAVVSEMPVARTNFYARRLRAGGVALHAPSLALRVVNGLVIAVRRSAAQRLIHGSGLLSRRLRFALKRLTVPGRGDVIHIHGCQTGQSWLIDWAQTRRVASVYTEHVAITDSGGPLTLDGLARTSRAGAIACVSDQSRDSLSALLPKARSIAVTGHILADVPSAAGKPITNASLDLLCVTRMEPRKGIDILLVAIADMIDRRVAVRLTILGSGPLDPSMRQLATDLGLGTVVRFDGHVSPDAVTARMMNADAVVIPSRSEGMPLALLEAMACGKAIVATTAGGIPEIAQHRDNALLVPIDVPKALADALSELALDSALRDRLGKSARRTWEGSRHRAAEVVPEILQLYREAQAAC